jgi:hypothetical protein
MSRGRLGKAILTQIHQQLPDLQELQETILSLTPSVISMKFHPDSSIPVAAVCFQDALSTLEEARYATHEAIASIIYYQEKLKPPNELGAVFLGRFYADDAALRLYSSGEHLANAIIFMLELTDQQLKPYQGKRISQQSILGGFLRKEGALSLHF